ncbi:1476_t:CDS:2 [Diversispora eburnea]|uniref:1476_t:CDS:1 n=1 Tax=Diversispora eburnea TaxID=1213867 RepID=A0A9N8ZCX0_9GLOM|nr:1476_t:CDS:2 [Diversispora eburnea]
MIKIFINSTLILIPSLFLFSSDTTPNTKRHRFMILWPWEEKRLISKADECVEIVLGSESILPDDDPRKREADLLGQEIMARAGYDPAKAIELWELMNKFNLLKIVLKNFY